MEPQVKGQTVKSMLLYLQSALTPGELDKTLATLAPAERQLLDRPILSTATFPMALVNKLNVEGARAGNKALPEFARDAGRFAAREGVKGVYRLFTRVLTVEALLSKAASMWSSMNTSGRMEIQASDSHHAVLRLLDFPSPDPVLCLRIAGWCEQLAQLAGARGVTVTHARCAAKGESVDEWQLTW